MSSIAERTILAMRGNGTEDGLTDHQARLVYDRLRAEGLAIVEKPNHSDQRLVVRKNEGEFSGANVVLVTTSGTRRSPVRTEVLVRGFFVMPAHADHLQDQNKIGEANDYAEILAGQLGIDHTKLEV